MAVLLKNDMFTFWFWILVIGRYAIMFRFDTRFLALTVFPDTRPSGADTTLNLDAKVRALADSTTKVHKLGRLFIPLPCRLNSQRVRRCVGMLPQVHGLGLFF